MTLHQLKIFAAISRHLNITQAARELGISQSSASEQMKLLEAEYEVQLLRKVGRGIELTEQGEAFLDDAEAILTEVENLKKKYRAEWSRRKEASVTVGGSHGPSASFLPLLLAVFKETHPHVALTLRTDMSQGIARLLMNSEVDIGVVTNPPHDPSIIVEPCWQEKLVAFVSAKHPLAKKDKLTLAELASTPLVSRAEGRGVGQILQQLQSRGFEPNIVMRCESPEAVKAAVRAGIGLGFLYEQVIQYDLGRGDLKILKTPEQIKVQTAVIYHKERSLCPDAQNFLALLRKSSKKGEMAYRKLRYLPRSEKTHKIFGPRVP